MNSQTYFILQQLVSREMKRKYSRSKLGILWSVFNPLLSMMVLSVIFSTMFRKSIENYPIYYLTGFVIWNFFTTATNTAMTSLVDNQTLILQIKLPRYIFPLSRVITAFINFMYSVTAYIVMLALFKIPAKSSMLFLPYIIFSVFLFAIGIGYILSILYVFFGDIRHLYNIGLTLWMYLSVLFYPIELLPESLQILIWQNPIYNFIAGARYCILLGSIPPFPVIVRIGLWGIIVFLTGTILFKNYQSKVIQKI